MGRRLKVIVAFAAIIASFVVFTRTANAEEGPVLDSHSADCESVTGTFSGLSEGGTYVLVFSPSYVEGGGQGGATPFIEGTSGSVTVPWSELGPDTSQGGVHTYQFVVAGQYNFGPFEFNASDCVEGEPETTTLPLHNDTADAGKDCPDQTNDYWHFVLTPNNGSSAFVSITLSLDGDLVDFNGEDIIPNGTQNDNVFVAVPDGYALDDLELEGSSAEVTGPATKFVLSHTCDGGTTTSSSTTSTTTSTTSTTVSSNTTPTTGAQQPTQVGGVTIPRVQQDPATLPRTGSNLALAFFATAFLAAGALALGAKHKLLKQ